MLLSQNRAQWPDLSLIKPIERWPQGRPLRVLFASDALFTTTGYGKQALLAVAALHRLGVDVAFIATYGISGSHFELPELPGVKVYSGGADGFANDVIPLAYEDWKADVLITLKDTPVFRPEVVGNLRWAPLTPVDHEPAPPQVQQMVRAAWWPIAYAPNGVRSMRSFGMNPLYVPHAYDPEVFQPGDRQAARIALGWPKDAPIISTVAVNRGGIPSRKAWPQLFEAMGIVRQKLGDKAPLWYCHTSSGEDGFEGGVNLAALAHAHGVADRIVFPDQRAYRYAGGYDEQFIANVYRASHLLLAVSLGEGFGVPILESQACGTPAIGGRWCAVEDLLWSEPQLTRADALPYVDQQGSHVFIPNPQRIADVIMAHLEHPQTVEQQEHMLRNANEFTIQQVADNEWRDAVLVMADRIVREDRYGRGVLQIIRKEELA